MIKPKIAGPRTRIRDAMNYGTFTWTGVTNTGPGYDQYVLYGPITDPFLSQYGTREEIADVTHTWPPEKGSYVFDDMTLLRKNYSFAVAQGTFERTAIQGGYWGPAVLQGNLVAYARPLLGPGVPVIPDWINIDGEAMKLDVINQAYSKAYSSTSQLLVSFSELEKSVQMVRRPFAGARKLLSAMTRRYKGLLGKGVLAVQAAQQAWLEYRMGWKPLLFDLENIQKAVHKTLSDIDQQVDQTYRASLTQSWEGRGEAMVNGGWFNTSIMGVSINLERKHSAGVILRENLYDEKSKDWTARLGLELHDVAPSVWELVPYSFVIDRFLSVQTWLEAIQPRPNTKVMVSWQTTTENLVEKSQFLTAQLKLDNPPYPTVSMGAGLGIDVRRDSCVFRKTRVTPSLYPAINTRDLSLVQHIDHAALVIGQLVGLFPEVNRSSFGRKH